MYTVIIATKAGKNLHHIFWGYEQWEILEHILKNYRFFGLKSAEEIKSLCFYRSLRGFCKIG